MKLVAYTSGEGGGMLGGHSSTSVNYTGDGRCQVLLMNRLTHNHPYEKVKYYADGLLEKLNEVCERYNVSSWTDLPGEEIAMLDSPSRSENFTFLGGTRIAFDNRRIYPDYVWEMLREIKQLIEESKKYAVDVEVSEEVPLMAMSMMSMNDINAGNKADNVQKESVQDDDVKWAKFCIDCGTKFVGDQKFCGECGAVRQKQ